MLISDGKKDWLVELHDTHDISGSKLTLSGHERHEESPGVTQSVQAVRWLDCIQHTIRKSGTMAGLYPTLKSKLGQHAVEWRPPPELPEYQFRAPAVVTRLPLNGGPTPRFHLPQRWVEGSDADASPLLEICFNRRPTTYSFQGSNASIQGAARPASSGPGRTANVQISPLGYRVKLPALSSVSKRLPQSQTFCPTVPVRNSSSSSGTVVESGAFDT
jgi:hypothetical protein